MSRFVVCQLKPMHRPKQTQIGCRCKGMAAKKGFLWADLSCGFCLPLTANWWHQGLHNSIQLAAKGESKGGHKGRFGLQALFLTCHVDRAVDGQSLQCTGQLFGPDLKGGPVFVFLGQLSLALNASLAYLSHSLQDAAGSTLNPSRLRTLKPFHYYA